MLKVRVINFCPVSVKNSSEKEKASFNFWMYIRQTGSISKFIRGATVFLHRCRNRGGTGAYTPPPTNIFFFLGSFLLYKCDPL